MKRILALILILFSVSAFAQSTSERHQFAAKLWGDDNETVKPETNTTKNGTAVPVAMYVNAAPSAWHSSSIEEKIATLLTRTSTMKLARLVQDTSMCKSELTYSVGMDSLVHRAEVSGARYAVAIRVTSPEIVRKKTLSVPLIFHMYQAMGIIEGELRIIDLNRNRQVAAEPFSISMKGPRAMQATMDDDINDPDLHVSAPEKLRFFDQLEQKAAEHISNRVRKFTRGG
jgi:hypothetical protein